MVEDMKKQMRRFENLIGFKGKLDVTSRDSMKKLIVGLTSKYKKDVQNSLRLHQLEFYYDLVENQHRKREKREKDTLVHLRASSKSSRKKAKRPAEESESKPKEEDRGHQLAEETEPDEVVKITANDIDDWKNFMTLSKIYYVMEHPRSVGLTWKRRFSKKKKIDTFGDKDLIEWRVSQNFRLRGLEEWAQKRSVARSFEEHSDSDDIDEDSREMDVLFEMLDPSDRTKSKMQNQPRKKLSPDRPFVFYGERLEDWTESYSEDSEYSDVEDFSEEIEDFLDKEKTEYAEDFSAEKDLLDKEKTEIFDSEEQKISPVLDKEDVSELLAVYPEFSKYKEPIFREMDEAKTFEEWLKLYQIAVSQLEEQRAKEETVDSERKLDRILEDEEAEEDEEAFGQKMKDSEEKVDTGISEERDLKEKQLQFEAAESEISKVVGKDEKEEKLVEENAPEEKITHSEENDDKELRDQEKEEEKSVEENAPEGKITHAEEKDDKGLREQEKEEDKSVEEKASKEKITHVEEKDDKGLREQEKEEEKLVEKKTSKERNTHAEEKDDKGLQEQEKEEEKSVEKKTSKEKNTHVEEKDDTELLEKEDKRDEKMTGEKMSEEENVNLEEINEGKQEDGSVNENQEAGTTPFEENINSQNQDIEKVTTENGDKKE